MKRIYLTIMVAMAFLSLKAQTFSFTMRFRDAAGNTDSIILGYSPTATDSIDAAFGEVNIDSTSLDTDLDVRIGNTDYQGNPNASGAFQTKKQIAYNYCGSGDDFSSHIQSINIYTKYWPVTATWNSSLFNDTCRYGSIFTSFVPGGWFDVSSLSNLGKVIMSNTNTVIFTRNYDGSPQSGYITNGDTVSNFWFVFADSSLLTLGIKNNTTQIQKIKIYPNPSTQTFEVHSSSGFAQKPRIFNLMGQSINTPFKQMDKTDYQIDMSGHPKGIYFIRTGTTVKRLVLE